MASNDVALLDRLNILLCKICTTVQCCLLLLHVCWWGSVVSFFISYAVQSLRVARNTTGFFDKNVEYTVKPVLHMIYIWHNHLWKFAVSSISSLLYVFLANGIRFLICSECQKARNVSRHSACARCEIKGAGWNWQQ